MKRQDGVTLVELLVAMALSLGIIASVLTLLSASMQTSRVAQNLGAAHNGAQIALGVIGESLQLAGFGEIAGSDFVRVGQTLHTGPHLRGCTTTNFIDGVGATPNLACATAVAPGDALFVCYQGDSVLAASQGVLRDCTRQAPVVVTQPGVGVGANRPVPLVRNAYFLDGERLVCGGNGRAAELLAANVVEFRVFYGVDGAGLNAAATAATNLAPMPSRFVTAATLNALAGTLAVDPWDFVVSAMVCMTVRAQEAGTQTVAAAERCPASDAEAAGGTALVGTPRADGAVTRTFVEIFNVRSRAAATASIGAS
jgi:type IV pilus assembly protein PilW